MEQKSFNGDSLAFVESDFGETNFNLASHVMMHRRSTGIIILVTLFIAVHQLNAQSDEVRKPFDFEEARQFDFWIGQWDVNLRMIQPDATWKDSVKARVQIYRILGGKAILELWDSKTIKGFSLRYYDPAKKKWVLHLNWPGKNQANLSSLEGAFRHGRGEFFSGRGKQVNRYTFCDITENSLRWDDAYSRDGGKTWNNNWIMEFSRTGPKGEWPESSFAAHTYVDGKTLRP